MSLIFAKTRRGGGPCMFSTAIRQVYGQAPTQQVTVSLDPTKETETPTQKRKPFEAIRLHLATQPVGPES